MTDLDHLSNLSAAGIGRLLMAGQASAVEVAGYFLERTKLAEAANVYLAITNDRALAEAHASDQRRRAGRPASALDGVPIAWKDLYDVAGTITTAGSKIYHDAPEATADAPCVANASAAGLVCIGKLNLSEFAFSGLGINPHFGTPHNPHDRTTPRLPGGSSSGCGVAVAAGLVPCAIGSDTGGSVRIPAAFNGVVGYKSSMGRIDATGVFPLAPSLDTVGPLARTVEDCVLLDAALRGAATPTLSRRSVSDLEIVAPTNVVMETLEDAVATNFEAALDRLAEAGARITRRPLPVLDEIIQVGGEHGILVAAEAYHVHRALIDGPDAATIDRRIVKRILMGKAMSADNVISIIEARRRLIPAFTAELGGALVAMPTVAHVAPAIAPLEADDELFRQTNLKTLRNTLLGNFLDLCALAIPSGTDSAGLPTSILISATGGDDERLFGYGLEIDRILRG